MEKKKVTDVLTFSQNYINTLKYIIGDIVISLEQVIYHSHILGIYIYEELTILVVHGLLHFLGFDHSQGVYNYLLQKFIEIKILSYFNINTRKTIYTNIYTAYMRD